MGSQPAGPALPEGIERGQEGKKVVVLLPSSCLAGFWVPHSSVMQSGGSGLCAVCRGWADGDKTKADVSVVLPHCVTPMQAFITCQSLNSPDGANRGWPQRAPS